MMLKNKKYIIFFSRRKMFFFFLIITISILFVNCNEKKIVLNEISPSLLRIKVIDCQLAMELSSNENIFSQLKYIPIDSVIFDQNAVKSLTINYEEKYVNLELNDKGKYAMEIYTQENIGKMIAIVFRNDLLGYSVINSVIIADVLSFTIGADELLLLLNSEKSPIERAAYTDLYGNSLLNNVPLINASGISR